MKIILAITGASGMPYAIGLLDELLKREVLVELIISRAGLITLNQELEVSLSSNPKLIKSGLVNLLRINESTIKLEVYTNNDWYAPSASGSSIANHMVICPCSMASLAKIASGIGEDLICRSADVIIKEHKNLILVPRETPLSAIHLENMLKLARLGVNIVPPVPGFYTKPKSVNDIINFTVSKVLDLLGIDNQLSPRWGNIN